MSKLIEQLSVKSLVPHGGELIFSKEKFAELIVKECAKIVNSIEQYEGQGDCSTAEYIKEYFGVDNA